MKNKPKLRDLFAIPFLWLALNCDAIAIIIGSAWTSELVLHRHIEDK